MTQLYGKIFHMQARVVLTSPHHHPCFGGWPSLFSSHVGVQTILTIPRHGHAHLRHQLRHGADTTQVLICTGRPEPPPPPTTPRQSRRKAGAAYLDHSQWKSCPKIFSRTIPADLEICAKRASEVSNSCNQYGVLTVYLCKVLIKIYSIIFVSPF